MSTPSVQKVASFCFGLTTLIMLVGSGTANQETDATNVPPPRNAKRRIQITTHPNMSPANSVAITAVRNLNNEHWPKDLEVVVKNNYPKPIYYLEITLTLPEISSTELDSISRTYSLPLTYGREDLWRLENLATSEDIPLNPGEVIRLRIREQYWKGLESHLARRNVQGSAIKTMRISIDTINFGDGTGIKMGKLVVHQLRSSKDRGQQNQSTWGLKETSRIINVTYRTTRVRGPSPIKPLAQSCGPSGISPRCALYEEVRETCWSGNCQRIIFSAYYPNPNATCIGQIEYDYLECSPGQYCSRDRAYSCDDWLEAGQCPNMADYMACRNQGGTWSPSNCSCSGLPCLPGQQNPHYVCENVNCELNYTCGIDECDANTVPIACEPPCYWSCLVGGCTGCQSPVIIDVLGDGFSLTGIGNGVDFDMDGNGTRERLGWTGINSDEAFLALDRNLNGTIDNGQELFGNYTPQPESGNRNGFIALAEYDKLAKGGNNNGKIDDQDAIFLSLRLWQDRNHNGLSESGELHTLPSLAVASIDLRYKESKQTDQFGNQFRYRAKVRDAHGAQLGKWAWDVFLVSQ